MSTDFPNPEGKISVLRRYLHILALLQHIPEGEKPERWNARKLADLLSLEEESGRPLDDSLVRSYMKTHIEEELGIDIDKTRGGLSSALAEDIGPELQLEIARVYAQFVIKDTTRDMVLKKFTDALPKTALWTLARVYFAVIEKRMIKFDYVNNSGYKIKGWELCPCYFILRNNNLYLVVWDTKNKKHLPLLAERISNLSVTEIKSGTDRVIPPPEELFSDSLSAFINDEPPVLMKIRYSSGIRSTIENIISPLEPEIEPDSEGWFTAAFHITDYLYLCRQLVMYGDNAEVLAPKDVRKAMVKMLKNSLSVYEG